MTRLAGVLGAGLLAARLLAAQAPTTTQAVAALPLSSHPSGQQMMEQAVKSLALDVSFKFLDKTYENDVYVRDPITGKRVRTSCVRFRTTSGFALRTAPPSYQLTSQGLTVTERIEAIDAVGLSYKFQLGPCLDVGGGFGIKARNVTLTFRARPTIKVEEGGCRVSLNAMLEETRVSIGDLNVLGVQNDLDKLAKHAVEDGVNSTLANFFNRGLGSGLAKAAIGVCGGAKKR